MECTCDSPCTCSIQVLPRKNVFENNLPPIVNGVFSNEIEEVISSGFPIDTVASLSLSSVAENHLDSPVSDDCIESPDFEGGQQHSKNTGKFHSKDAKHTFKLCRGQVEETFQIAAATHMEEVDVCLSPRGMQISSAKFNNNGGNDKEDRLIVEAKNLQPDNKVVKEVTSLHIDEALVNVVNTVGQDQFEYVLDRKKLDPGLMPTGEATVQPNMPVMESTESSGIGMLRKSSARASKEWSFKPCNKAKSMRSLLKDKDEQVTAENFASEGVCIDNGRKKGHVESQLVDALGSPLGMSIAAVLAESLESNYQLKKDISAEKLSQLLGLAIRESLYQLLGSGCNRMARDFEGAFITTFKTIRLVKQVHCDNWRMSSLSEEKISNPHGQRPGLATDGCVNDAKVEHTDIWASLGGKLKQISDCKKLTQEHSCGLCSAQENGMNGVGQQLCKPSFMEADMQATLSTRHEASKGNCIVDCHKNKRCITAAVSDAECNNCNGLNSSILNEPSGDGPTSFWKTGFVENKIEEISKKLNNIKLESADCKDISVGDLPHVASESTRICKRIGENVSELTRTIYDNCKTSNMSSSSMGAFPFIATDWKNPTGERNGQHFCELKKAIHDDGKTSSMPGSNLNQQVVLHGQFEQQLVHAASSMASPQWKQSICNVFEKSVIEQERCNDLREIEIGLTMRQLHLEESKLSVDAESNDLRRQKISFSQSKASFKESKFIDEKLNDAYMELSRTCADLLVAGLLVMLFCLACGGWKYSYARLSEAVAMCQPSSEDSQKSSWFYNPIGSVMKSSGFYNPIGSVTGHFQILLCELTVIFRMLLGFAAIAVIASTLVRNTVISTGQARPTTIIVLLLGLVCGCAGKFSVDTLGGSGFHWLVQWEVFCLLHAFSTYFPASLFWILNGPASSLVGIKKNPLWFPSWIRKFVFHTILLVLPVMAGLTPFAPIREWAEHISLVIFDNVLEPMRTSVSSGLEQFSSF